MRQNHLITGDTSVKPNPASPEANSDQRNADRDAPDRRWPWFAPLLVALLLSPTLLYPFARDQAVFTYVGKTIAEGGMPYRDAWDLKPPGIYLAYAAFWQLSGSDAFRMMTVTRVADVLLACVTGLLLVLLGRKLRNPWIGLAAAGWYAALYLQETYWGMAQAESWSNPLVLAAALLLMDRGSGSRIPQSAAAGLLLGMVALLKPTALLPALPFLLSGSSDKSGAQTRSAKTAAVVIACAVVPALAAFLWLKAGGAWDAYVDIQQGFVAPYARLHAPDMWKRVENVFGYTLGWSRDHWAPIALGVVGGLWSRKTSDAPLLGKAAVALGMAWLGVCVQNKYFGYHWQPLLPFLALLAGVGTAAVLERLYPLIAPRWAVAAPLAWAVSVAGGDIAAGAQRSAGAMSATEWNTRFGPPGRGDYSFEADREVAEWLRKHSQPDDRIQIWGFEPAIYLMADRNCATRFFFNVPVAVEFTPQAWRSEFLQVLNADPPEWLIVARNDAIPWASGRTDDSATQLADWPALREWVNRNYKPAEEIEDFRILSFATPISALESSD